MFRPSDFGARYTRRTAAAELMLDLADAMSAPPPVYMLGGGNPARIPEVEAVYRRRLVEIAADPVQFGRFAGQYSDPAGDPAFRDAVAGALSAQYGWRVERRNVALTSGSQVAFFFLFNWLAGPQAGGARRRLLLPLAPEYIGYADLGVADGMLLSSRRASSASRTDSSSTGWTRTPCGYRTTSPRSACRGPPTRPATS